MARSEIQWYLAQCSNFSKGYAHVLAPASALDSSKWPNEIKCINKLFLDQHGGLNGDAFFSTLETQFLGGRGFDIDTIDIGL